MTEGVPAPLPVGLLSFAIHLIGYDSGAVAQFVNPLTFHWNNIAEPGWACEPKVSVGITRSTFAYTNGVQIEATENNVVFKQEGTPLDMAQILIAGVAQRYVDAFGADRWGAVSSEFTVRIAPQASVRLAGSTLPELLDRLVSDGVRPQLQISTQYALSDKEVAVVVCPDEHPYTSIFCSGRVLRELNEEPKQALTELGAILGDWQTEWEEIIGVIVRLLTTINDLRRLE